MASAWAACVGVVPARSRNESRIGGPTHSRSSSGEGTGSPNSSNMYPSDAVMPGAESAIVPSRSNRMQVQSGALTESE